MLKIKRGMSLIEILLVLTVSMILAISAFYIYKEVSYHSKANSVQMESRSVYDQVSEISSRFKVDKNEVNYGFPYELLDVGLVENKNYYNPQYDGIPIFVSPFKGHYYIYTYPKDEKSESFDNLNIILSMEDYDVKSCVKIANNEIKNSALRVLLVNNEPAFITSETSSTGRSEDEATIRENILTLCNQTNKDPTLNGLNFLYVL